MCGRFIFSMRTLVGLFVLLAVPSLALAQHPGPIPAFAIDVRGFNAGLGRDSTTATELGIDSDELPGRGFGAVAGIHGYLLRSHKIVLGVSGESLIIRGRAQLADAEGEPIGLSRNQRVRGLSANMSINFGTRDGWSYLTAGMGPLAFWTYSGDVAPEEPPPAKMTINLGGGARWFFASHVAFNVDARFYQTRPEDTTFPYPGRQRTKLTVLSAGISFR